MSPSVNALSTLHLGPRFGGWGAQATYDSSCLSKQYMSITFLATMLIISTHHSTVVELLPPSSHSTGLGKCVGQFPSGCCRRSPLPYPPPETEGWLYQ